MARHSCAAQLCAAAVVAASLLKPQSSMISAHKLVNCARDESVNPQPCMLTFCSADAQEEGLRLGEALALVRKARTGACPNAGFMRQLSALAHACERARGGEHGGALSARRPGGVRDIC